MRYATAATYLPECMVITLKKDLDALSTPDDIRGFEGAEQIGFIFHEWIHFLHNISTLHGLTAFMNMLSLWAAFRFTKNGEAYSAGMDALGPDVAMIVQQRLAYLAATRRSTTKDFPDIPLDNLRIKSITESSEPIVGTELELKRLVCNMCSIGDESLEWKVEIGAHEIVEGAAWMLEEKLVTSLKGISQSPSVIPYKVVRNIFKLYIPSISDDAIIACMLCSLQDSDPPAVLFEILQAARDLAEKQRDIFVEMCGFTRYILQKNEKWRSEFLAQIENMLPVEEPLMHMIRHVVMLMRKNFEERVTEPFFEFSIIKSLSQDPQAMDFVINAHGGCGVIQTRSGSIHEVARDLMYDFGSPDASDPSLEFGRRKMHAAFHYMRVHIFNDAFVPTERINNTEGRARCPFYTTCNLSQRSEHGSVCWESPWRTAEIDNDDIQGCWYRAGVIATTGIPKKT